MDKYTVVHTENGMLFHVKNDFSSHKKTWSKLKRISQSERNQYEKAIYYMILTIRHSGNGKIMERVKRLVFARGWWESRGINRQSTEDS